MKAGTGIRIVVLVLLCASAAVTVQAGRLFFQTRLAASRRCIPAFDYRSSRAGETGVVVSQVAVPVSRPNAAGNGVDVTERLFVIPDAAAGLVRFTKAAGRIDVARKTLVVSGILTHTGGTSGQQKAGKAVIRVDALGGGGTVVAPAPVLARSHCACWVRAGEPETVQLLLRCDPRYLTGIESSSRIRLFLEYHPSR